MRPVLYYVHHHGLGHWRRALAVTAHLDRPVVLASSAPPPHALPAHATYLPLPMDAQAGPAPAGVDANGRLHWAPSGHAGLLRRHHLLLAEYTGRHAVTAVVDVSMEVAVLLRTSGVPVIAVRLPGERVDPAHQLGFDLADQVVMPVPQAWGLHRGLARTRAVGLVGAPESPAGAVAPGAAGAVAAEVAGAVDPEVGPAVPQMLPAPSGRPRVLVVVGTGGSSLDPRACARIAAELPGHDVRVIGLEADPGEPVPVNLTFAGRVADPRPELAAAAVVVGNAGLGTVSDVVTARRPFVVLPEHRPFGEQAATARALAATGHAVVLPALPPPGGWGDAVTQAAAAGPADLVVDGAARFAGLVEQMAARQERAAAGFDDPTPAGLAVPR